VPASAFDQNADGFPICQPRAEHLQPSPGTRARCNFPHHADALGKTVENLEFESRYVDLLKLFRRIRHGKIGQLSDLAIEYSNEQLKVRD
jgi:hypothetical protein